MSKESEQDFWKEDADRLNQMAELAKGVSVDVKEGEPPELNDDGSLKEGSKSED